MKFSPILEKNPLIENESTADDLQYSPLTFVFKYDKGLNITYSNSPCQKYLDLNPGKNIPSDELELICGLDDCYELFQEMSPVKFSRSRININGYSLVVNWANFTSFVENDGPGEITSIGFDISDWSLIKQKLDDVEKKYKILFDYIDVPIIITDLMGKILEVNNEACRMLGYSREDLLSISYKNVLVKEYSELVEKKIGEISKKSNFEFTLEIVKKNGRILLLNCKSKITNIEGNNVIFTVARDVTEKQEKEEHEQRRRLKYYISNGNIYFTDYCNKDTAIDAFNNLLACNYSGIVLSSRSEDEFRKIINNDFRFYWINNLKISGSISSNYSCIDLVIEDIPRNSAVLIDDVEYFEAKNSDYRNTLLFIKSLKEIALIKSSVFILCADMNIIEEKVRYVIEKEANKITGKTDEVLSFNMERILSYISEKNNSGGKPSQTEICKGLKITRPTIKRNISELVSRKYLIVHLEGRSKRLEVTAKGRKELKNNIC